MTEQEARVAVVSEAITWINTPWRHQGNLRGVGVDCGHFMMAPYVACGIIEPVDPGNYSRHWNLHRTDEVYLGFVQQHTREIARAEIGPGDVFLCRYGLTYSHGGIIIDPPRVLHAYVRQGVVEADLSEALIADHAPRFFSPWGR